MFRNCSTVFWFIVHSDRMSKEKKRRYLPHETELLLLFLDILQLVINLYVNEFSFRSKPQVVFKWIYFLLILTKNSIISLFSSKSFTKLHQKRKLINGLFRQHHRHHHSCNKPRLPTLSPATTLFESLLPKLWLTIYSPHYDNPMSKLH